jgi:hypothetical protein
MNQENRMPLSARQRLEAAEVRARELRAELSDVVAARTAAEAEREDFVRKLDAIESRRAELEESIRRMEAELGGLDGASRQLRAETERRGARSRGLNAAAAELQKEIDAAVAETVSLEGAVHAEPPASEPERLKQAKGELEDRVARLQNDRQALVTQLDFRTRKLAELTRDLSAAEQELARTKGTAVSRDAASPEPAGAADHVTVHIPALADSSAAQPSGGEDGGKIGYSFAEQERRKSDIFAQPGVAGEKAEARGTAPAGDAARDASRGTAALQDSAGAGERSSSFQQAMLDAIRKSSDAGEGTYVC